MLKAFNGDSPVIEKNAYIAETAELIGRVTIKEGASVWPQSVLRGDVEEIRVGRRTNIQDGTIIHTNYNLPVIIGDGVTVGHRVVLHGCVLGAYCLIGMGAIILDGAVVPEWTLIAAGALVPERKKLESGLLYMGVPAKPVRKISDDEKELIRKRAEEYVYLSKMHSE